ncbi:hypothetical protein ACQ4PT_070141 [Festuca glaucescens]
MSCEMTASLRRLSCSPAAPPLEDDNLLAEILLRLPPQPSSLPRASAVSKRWRSLASDPRFCSRFRAHHRRNPPLLGCFVMGRRLKGHLQIHFKPTLDSPNRIPEDRFTFPIDAGDSFLPLGSRHGLMLILHGSRAQLLVWDPVTGDQHRLDIPPGFEFDREDFTRQEEEVNAAVFRAPGDIRHFQVVLVGLCERQPTLAAASVYSSETGVWGNIISTPLPPEDPDSFVSCRVDILKAAVMSGDSLYWLIPGDPFLILEFDLDRRSLAFIPMPRPGEDTLTGFGEISVTLAEDGVLGFLFLAGFCVQLWKRKTDCDSVDSWVLERSIQLDKLLSLNPKERFSINQPSILGLAEDNHAILVWTPKGIFSVQLESLQFKKLFESYLSYHYCPFEGVYTADMGIGGGQRGAELLHNTEDDFSQ